MAGPSRPRGRAKNVTGSGKGVYKRGSGLGSGSVGRGKSSGGSSGGSGFGGSSYSGGSGFGGGDFGSGGNPPPSRGPRRSSGKKGGKGGLIALLAVLLLSGGGVNILGGDSDVSDYGSYESYPEPTAYVQSTPRPTPKPTPRPTQAPQSSYGSQSGYSSFDELFSAYSGNSYSSYTGGSVSSGWDYGANTGKLDTSVAKSARDKYTQIKGGGKDSVTIMVYMCGTDLESQSGMATSDLQEMAKATIGSNVNVIVYTGGCSSWRNSIVSSSTNQIYKVESGGLKRLDDDAGRVSMTKPATLASFIDFCASNYPADRNQLIFWDHGGGSISGFGYDQKFQSSGSMTLQGIDQALSQSKLKFDFIGFDACLMATTETALMLSDYADYLIASEETEPGTGWYYTGWLTSLSNNSSMPTIQLGRQIIDDFVEVCAQQTRGQQTTLSIVDLAELSATVPQALNDFSQSTLELINNDRFKDVSKARSASREFAVSTKIDQMDLVHLALNIGGDEAEALADALLGAVKYNRTSSNVTNAYGLSIYFPYRKTANVSKAVDTYEAIGMDAEYSRCIEAFASVETGGQAASGYSASPFGSLFDYYSSGSSYGSGYGSSYGSSGSGYGSGYDSYYGSSSGYSDYDAVAELLESLMGYGSSSYSSSYGNPYGGYYGRSMNTEDTAGYLTANRFDASALTWTEGAEGWEIALDESQWELVNQLELNVFFDDGEGFIDLGMDNVFEFTEEGALMGSYDGTWLAIDEQPVAYYHLSTVDDGENYSITGRVPVLLNGARADLILVFDNDEPYGYIAGARYDYRGGETDTVAKNLGQLNEGDVIDFLCDYYSYDGEYLDSYMLGERYVYSGQPEISNVYIDEAAAMATYRFVDIYQQEYWTEVLP